MSNVHHYTQVPKMVGYVETKQYLKNMPKEK